MLVSMLEINIKTLSEIEDRYYFTPIKEGLEEKIIDNFKVGFITTNFYNEIINPQQKGMLKFFDFVYITKGREVGKANIRIFKDFRRFE